MQLEKTQRLGTCSVGKSKKYPALQVCGSHYHLLSCMQATRYRCASRVRIHSNTGVAMLSMAKHLIDPHSIRAADKILLGYASSG